MSTSQPDTWTDHDETLHDEVNSMRDVIVTLGHCTAQMFERCMEQVARTRTTAAPHYFVYHHYPIKKKQNRIDLLKIAEEHKMHWLDPGKNIGLHAGLNWAIEQIGLTPGDRMIGVDPDTFPLDRGWDAALLSILNEDEHTGWAALSNDATPNEVRDRRPNITRDHVAGQWVLRCGVPMCISIAAIKMNWVLASGGFREPNAFYGGIEVGMWPHLLRAGYGLTILEGYREDGTVAVKQDPEYAEWKRLHSSGKFPSNFHVYCASIGKG